MDTNFIGSDFLTPYSSFEPFSALTDPNMPPPSTAAPHPLGHPHPPSCDLTHHSCSDIPTSGKSATPTRTLFIGNLPFGATVSQLHALAAPHCPVECRIIESDGRSRGFGYIDFPTESHAIAARTALQGYILMGRPMRVDFSAPTRRLSPPRAPPLSLPPAPAHAPAPATPFVPTATTAPLSDASSTATFSCLSSEGFTSGWNLNPGGYYSLPRPNAGWGWGGCDPRLSPPGYATLTQDSFNHAPFW